MQKRRKKGKVIRITVTLSREVYERLQTTRGDLIILSKKDISLSQLINTFLSVATLHEQVLKTVYDLLSD